ncbi:30S ribosomal protein S4 [Candidatus Hepatincolaceae symbiont of Richtersius coronifer]
MTKRHNAKYKIDRRLSVNLWGRTKSPFNVRPSRPGQHGAQHKKPSDYGVQLIAKQKLKGYYANIGEKQFRKYFEEALRRKGDTSQNLIGLLESRLDAVVYRMKFVSTMFAARQFVNHGHILVNGKRVNIPSYLVKEGDEIEIKGKSKELAIVFAAISSGERDVPSYMEANHTTMKGKYLHIPKLEDVPFPAKMDPNTVVEYYSR